MTDPHDVARGLPQLSLPPPPAEPARPAFPWIASIAPVAGAVAITAITGSAFALVFAFLGPLVAVAGLLDGRRQARRDRRRAAREREEALAHLEEELGLRHDLERAAAWSAHPGVPRPAGEAVPRWRQREPVAVVVGTGAVTARTRVTGSPVDEAERALLLRAGCLEGAPILADPRGGIGFTGPRALVLAAARAAVLQCADAVPPDRLVISGPGSPEWAWLGGLPHAGARASRRIVVVELGDAPPAPAAATAARPGDRDGPACLIAVGRTAHDLPPGLSTVLALRHHGSARVSGEGDAGGEVVPELVSLADAEAWARHASASARRAGIGAGAGEPPDRVELSSLGMAGAPGRDRGSLRARVGAAGDGPVELDLVVGPHALVAGTSGSGKSEFILTWITALAAAYGPDRVAFLLVDFKGGAAFAPVAALPHVTGIVTDLAEAEAGRAVASIRAELRHRERVLADAGARDLSGLAPEVDLPRLVVVIDEFQAVVERFPELGTVIADVAARGRSLGVHLVLASQRPNGVVRESVTANCGIRVSLRVLHRADSTAIVGTEAAAELDPERPGRAVADPGDGSPVRFQSALADDAAIRAAAERHADAPRPRRPWLDPLPRTLRIDDAAEVLGGGLGSGPGILVGVADDPERQRRIPIVWHPGVDGALAVLGAPGSGRTALLDAVAGQFAGHEVLRVDGPRSAVWDALERIDHAVGEAGAGRPRLVVLDDLDRRFAGWPDDARLTAVARIERLLRAARGAGTAVVVAASRPGALGPAIREALTSTVLLRHPSAADLVHAGGDAALWDRDAPPGAGQWRGLRAQFLAGPRPPAPVFAPPPAWEPAGHPRTAVASATPRADAAAISRRHPGAEVLLLDTSSAAAGRAAELLDDAAAGPHPRLVIADADGWAAHWGLAARARATAAIVVHGGVAEYRALIRDPTHPPLLDDPRSQCWEVVGERRASRRAWLDMATDSECRQPSQH